MPFQLYRLTAEYKYNALSVPHSGFDFGKNLLPLTTKLSFCHYDSKFVWIIFKYPNKIEHLCYDHVPTVGMQLANFICKLFYSTIGIIATVI